MCIDVADDLKKWPLVFFMKTRNIANHGLHNACAKGFVDLCALSLQNGPPKGLLYPTNLLPPPNLPSFHISIITPGSAISTTSISSSSSSSSTTSCPCKPISSCCKPSSSRVKSQTSSSPYPPFPCRANQVLNILSSNFSLTIR